MAASPSDLTLDYKPNGGGAAYPAVAKQGPIPDHAAAEQAAQKLQEFLTRLEEERLKIDAFKRELPLCMQLLNHAMDAYRQQLEAYQLGSQGAARPAVLEEFIPLKNIGLDGGADKSANQASEKASWMVSAQLWNAPADAAAKGPQTPKELPEHPVDTSPRLSALDAHQRSGGAFLPFSKDKILTEGAGATAVHVLPELALAPTEKDATAEIEKKQYTDASSNGVGARRDQNGVKPATAQDGQHAAPPQTHRKARRCWSPDLHRRFVNALQILGGAQVATPKQIRELMKVDGLTNDEVKSHLQKYRLHTRRPMPAPAAPQAPAPQLVVLGGIWVPPEYAAPAAAPAIYGAHPATQPHYTAAVAAQEYYSSQAAVHQHLQHHQAAMHRAAVAPPPGYNKTRVGSPESEARSGRGAGGRDRSESIEEEGEGEEREEEEEDEDDIAAATPNPAAAKADEENSGAGAAKY